jgi:hypothetical protein
MLKIIKDSKFFLLGKFQRILASSLLITLIIEYFNTGTVLEWFIFKPVSHGPQSKVVKSLFLLAIT